MSDYISRDELFDSIKNDAVLVVRCKDCVYWPKGQISDNGFFVCTASGMEITKDDYCSYGERKEANT